MQSQVIILIFAAIAWAGSLIAFFVILMNQAIVKLKEDDVYLAFQLYLHRSSLANAKMQSLILMSHSKKL